MTIKVGINGFGRMGRLCLRAALNNFSIKNSSIKNDTFQFIKVNDPAGDAKTLAHLLEFDSIHGHWEQKISATDNRMMINDQELICSRNTAIGDTDWSDCDMVIEASGKMNKKALLEAYLKQGVRRVVVTAPVKEEGVLNIVMGINQHLYDKDTHPVITAASCTTNCLAPAVKVVHENFGIKHGSMTTIHDITNTQTIIDNPHKDLRRARACGMSLIPTTTGSATAITHIFPDLKGKLNGHAIRVPLTNASITDCVFELERSTTESEVNELLKLASENELSGILGYEERPLVSIDYRTDPRSCVVDALSTMVINGTQLKLYLWYDNEWGYANRVAELLSMVGQMDQ